MPAKRKQSQLSRRRRVIRFLVIPFLLIALLLFGAIQLIRISNLESEVQALGMDNFMHMVNQEFNPLVIDGLHKQAYVPDLNIVLPFDNQLTSTLRYMVYQDDTSSDNGTIQIGPLSEMLKTKWTDKGEVWSGCRVPFYITIGVSDAQDGMRVMSQKVLQDGRKSVLYESTSAECRAFLSSADGGTLVYMLQQMQSY